MDRAKLAAQLTVDEGRKSRIYLDTRGKWTGGVGFNFSDCPIPGHIIDALLDYKIDEAQTELDRVLPWWRTLNDARANALCNMMFQMGTDKLLGFKKTLELLKAGRWDAAATEALDSDWARQTPNRAKRVTDMIRTGEF
jgi:GH24 family phage-related lysozyme (muramidase)